MSIEAIKEELAKLDDAERHQIISFLGAIESGKDLEYRREMAHRIDDKDPANWMTLEDLQRELRLGEHAATLAAGNPQRSADVSGAVSARRD